MSVQMTIPFALGADGGISVESNADVQIHQRVLALAQIDAGTRPMLTSLGVPLHGLLFESITDPVVQQTAQAVKDLITAYEPGVIVMGVTPTVSPSDPTTINVTVSYDRRDAQNSDASAQANSNTVVISAGGTVTEVIRG
jgi:phage baseplate assembly protein W